jgi:hypothetical protein
LFSTARPPKTVLSSGAPALGYKYAGREHEPHVVLIDETLERPLLILQCVFEPKRGKNQLHIDVYADDIDAGAATLGGLGPARLEPERHDERGARWIVADRKGDEFCVCAGLP